MPTLQTILVSTKATPVSSGTRFVFYYGAGSDSAIESLEFTLATALGDDPAVNAVAIATSVNQSNGGSYPVINGEECVAAAVGPFVTLTYVTKSVSPAGLTTPRLLDLPARTIGLMSEIGVCGFTEVASSPAARGKTALDLVRAGVVAGATIVG